MSNKATLTLPERLDISETAALKDRMDKTLAKNAQEVVLKADKVERADSAGLQLLLSFMSLSDESDWDIKLQKPSDELLEAAQLLGCANHFS